LLVVVGNAQKETTAQIVHLVFVNAQSKNIKNQKNNFLPTPPE